jgi:hypothetical protein
MTAYAASLVISLRKLGLSLTSPWQILSRQNLAALLEYQVSVI